MGSSEFYVDFNIDVPDVGEAFVEEAERGLRQMSDGHTDIVGAAVALEKPVKAEKAYVYEVRIVLYKRPQVLTVTEQHADPMAALRRALDALEGQVLKSREKLWERGVPASEQTENVIYGLTRQEVFATYAKGMDPAQLLEEGRTQIASRLLLREGLTEEAAYFAADQILRVVTEKIESR
jgi:ribosome-associated translation inhibitor RaiA